MNPLQSDPTFFDDKFFFLFRNKYKPEILDYLREKHYFETENKITLKQKKDNTIIWNGILIREISLLGYTITHLEKKYNAIYEKTSKANTLDNLRDIEIEMVSKYIDIIIEQQESTDHLIVNRILHYLHMHIEDKFSLEKLTYDLNISQSHASKIFKDHMNNTIVKYSKHLKIERAKNLLKEDLSITEIGECLGFYDQAHFSRTFKSFVGVSPQKYKIDNFNILL